MTPRRVVALSASFVDAGESLVAATDDGYVWEWHPPRPGSWADGEGSVHRVRPDEPGRWEHLPLIPGTAAALSDGAEPDSPSHWEPTGT